MAEKIKESACLAVSFSCKTTSDNKLRISLLIEYGVEEFCVKARIEKITDIMEIAGHGVFGTPAVVVDGEVKSMVKIPKKEEVKNLTTVLEFFEQRSNGTMSSDEIIKNDRKMTSVFERLLSLWVILCIIAGILLGKIAPGVAQYLDGLAIYVKGAPVVSIPIAICLFS